ncbi:MAG: DNA mismatch repair protein MutS [Bacteroidia bacterium]|jgi:DNA mismatch repair protein MutS|nr:DNA mismatch repair protein MutS [Bacteroidia bacterium]
MSKKEPAETPLMKQYNQIKTKYPGAILLFRVGDFYETFGEDAIKAAQILGIVLTKRANGSASHIELAGFPHHALDTYLPKLVRAGQRVAICDQLEDPKLTKTIVKRGVTELITPGVSYNDKILDHKRSNYLAAIYFDQQVGVAFLDISTGEFMVAEGDADYIDKLVQGFKPAEIIVSKPQYKTFQNVFNDRFYTYQLDEWAFQYDFAREKLIRHFTTANLKGYGIEHMQSAVIAAGVCLHYLSETHHNHVQHIQSVSRIDEQQYVWLDRFTVRNLELLFPSNEGGVSLLDVLDKTTTPMGSRMLRKWLVLPLKDEVAIADRQQVVAYACQNEVARHTVIEQLKGIGDLERLISKVAMGRVNPRELQQLNRALKHIQPIQKVLLQSQNEKLVTIANQLHDCTWVMDKIDAELHPDPPIAANKGQVIQQGVHLELDQLREIAFSGKDYLLNIQTQEQQRTGISSLKVAYNNVFGYYLEVTNAHKDKVPPEWVRKQTLTNAERYITEELKQYEEKILGAEEKITAIEERLYTELVTAIAAYVSQIQQNASIIARIDCLFAFGGIAEKYNYIQPILNQGKGIDLTGARHPVIERQLPTGVPYIANDLVLNPEGQQVIILTGPNMSGKSALLRQTALIVIMAQMGSFVPCTSANIGIVDKIFTRVGASDNLSAGESTFMVEMTETASILNNISERSLILLDEIGRGTSTYDGVSIAWSIASFLSNHPYKPKTLFATHYHELNDLEQTHEGIRNYHIEIQESGQQIVFLRKLKPGGSEHSFGIHVAKMAGMPQIVVRKAQQMLARLEAQREDLGGDKLAKTTDSNSMQLSMFQLNDPLLEQLRDELLNIDVNTLSPIEALMKLNELKKVLKK